MQILTNKILNTPYWSVTTGLFQHVYFRQRSKLVATQSFKTLDCYFLQAKGGGGVAKTILFNRFQPKIIFVHDSNRQPLCELYNQVIEFIVS